ncbi:glycosyltransferase family 4 protein [candidate division WOR-3 bacterium]|nr:glycosyltransferase family 4 protein [candidate division WOR-3 bacterium]
MDKKRARVCIISFSDLQNDPRVRRQIEALKERYEITTLGLKKSEVSGIKELIFPADKRPLFKRIWSRMSFLLSRIFTDLYKEYIELKYPVNSVSGILKNEKFDFIIANGLEALIIAQEIAKRDKTPIMLDAHEYEPRMIEDNWSHRLFINPYKDFLCRKYLSMVSAMTTVSYGIAEEFKKVYEIKPDVIMNAPQYQKRELKKVDPDNIRIIHHGLAHPSRNLEDMLYLMPLLEERFHLTLMLVVRDRRYFARLKRLAEQICPERVDFREAVPFDNIIPAISEYDIQLIIYNPTSFNVKHSLPNKFFESIMAGLPIVTGPSPEMKRIIDEFDCGFAAHSFKVIDLANILNGLTSVDIMKKKKASLEAAKRLNAETEKEKLIGIVNEVLDSER